jgi:hypothetical protein
MDPSLAAFAFYGDVIRRTAGLLKTDPDINGEVDIDTISFIMASWKQRVIGRYLSNEPYDALKVRTVPGFEFRNNLFLQAEVATSNERSNQHNNQHNNQQNNQNRNNPSNGQLSQQLQSVKNRIYLNDYQYSNPLVPLSGMNEQTHNSYQRQGVVSNIKTLNPTIKSAPLPPSTNEVPILEFPDELNVIVRDKHNVFDELDSEIKNKKFQYNVQYLTQLQNSQTSSQTNVHNVNRDFEPLHPDELVSFQTHSINTTPVPPFPHVNIASTTTASFQPLTNPIDRQLIDVDPQLLTIESPLIKVEPPLIKLEPIPTADAIITTTTTTTTTTSPAAATAATATTTTTSASNLIPTVKAEIEPNHSTSPLIPPVPPAPIATVDLTSTALYPLIITGKAYEDLGVKMDIPPAVQTPVDLGVLTHRWYTAIADQIWQDEEPTEQDQPIGGDISKFLDFGCGDFPVVLTTGSLVAMKKTLVSDDSNKAGRKIGKGNGDEDEEGEVGFHLRLAIEEGETAGIGATGGKSGKKKKGSVYVWRFEFKNCFLRVGFEELFFHNLKLTLTKK